MSSYREQYDAIVKDIDYDSFSSINEALEKLIDMLEKSPSPGKDMNQDPYIRAAYYKADQLRDMGRDLLRQEKESIIRIALANGISLNEIGLSDDDTNED